MRLINADALTDYFSGDDATRRFLRSDFVEAVRNAPTIPTASAPADYQCVFPHAKTRDELLSADWDTLTDEEKERRQRAKAIPEAVVAACVSEYNRLRGEMMKTERKMDVIADFINGYKTEGCCHE